MVAPEAAGVNIHREWNIPLCWFCVLERQEKMF